MNEPTNATYEFSSPIAITCNIFVYLFRCIHCVSFHGWPVLLRGDADGPPQHSVGAWFM